MAYFAFLFGYQSDPEAKLFQDSDLAQPVLGSPQGKALLARYPDAETVVFQDFSNPDCCNVHLVYIRNNVETQIPRIVLQSHVSVDAGSQKLGVDELRLSCYDYVNGRADAWTVKGDIIQNLQPAAPDCWDTGPPSPPSDSELVQRAEDTEVAKAYPSLYPDSTISVKPNETVSNMPEVTFTSTSQPSW